MIIEAQEKGRKEEDVGGRIDRLVGVWSESAWLVGWFANSRLCDSWRMPSMPVFRSRRIIWLQDKRILSVYPIHSFIHYIVFCILS